MLLPASWRRYSDAGEQTCGRRPGSLGHEEQDAQTFAAWDVDYLKYDNCYNKGAPLLERYVQWPPAHLPFFVCMSYGLTDGRVGARRYTAMGDALNRTGRTISYALCEWGVDDPATWAGAVGNSWRTSLDIKPDWAHIVASVDANNLWADKAGPGGWNDPDSLEVGRGEFMGGSAEARSHFGLWCISKAPLILGNDLRMVDPDTRDLLLHPEAIALNQDPLGVQARLVAAEPAAGAPPGCDDAAPAQKCPAWAQAGQCRLDPAYMAANCAKTCGRCFPEGLHVWAGPLSGGRIVVGLWNRSNMTGGVTARWEDVGLKAGVTAGVRDVWARKDMKDATSQLTETVASHDLRLFVLTPRGFAGDTRVGTT